MNAWVDNARSAADTDQYGKLAPNQEHDDNSESWNPQRKADQRYDQGTPNRCGDWNETGCILGVPTKAEPVRLLGPHYRQNRDRKTKLDKQLQGSFRTYQMLTAEARLPRQNIRQRTCAQPELTVDTGSQRKT